MTNIEKKIKAQKENIEKNDQFLKEKFDELSGGMKENKLLTDSFLDAYNFIKFVVSIKKMCSYFLCTYYELIKEKRIKESNDIKQNADFVCSCFYNRSDIPDEIKEISKIYLRDFIFERLDFLKMLEDKKNELNLENSNIYIDIQ